MSTTPKAYSYIRFSTPQQAEGDSLRRQSELSARYAEEHGLLIDASLDLHDLGLSGFTGENRNKGALALFLQAVQSGLVPRGSFLLVESLDRLSRDTLSEQMTLFIGLINAGLTVVTLADGQRYSKATVDQDLSKLMLSLVVMMRAHEESLIKSRRLKAAWENKRKKASTEKLTSSCPSWLRLAPDRRAFVVIPERAELVQRIYRMSLDGHGAARIARVLNSEGISSWSGSKGWYASFIHRLLRNRAVLGEYQAMRRENSRNIRAGTPVLNYYPGILDVPTWQKAQERGQARPRGRVGRHFINLFSGIIFDGYTGSSMRLIQWDHSDASVNSPDHGYYLVSDYSRQCLGQKSVSWRYCWFEKWVLGYLITLDWSMLCEEREISQRKILETQIKTSQERSAQIAGELNRLVKLAKSSDSPTRTLLQEIGHLEEEQSHIGNGMSDLQVRIEAITAKEVSFFTKEELIKELARVGDQGSRLRLRHAIRDQVKRIDVFPNGAAGQLCTDAPASSLNSPSIKLTFLNEMVRWLCCANRNPFDHPARASHLTLPRNLL